MSTERLPPAELCHSRNFQSPPIIEKLNSYVRDNPGPILVIASVGVNDVPSLVSIRGSSWPIGILASFETSTSTLMTSRSSSSISILTEIRRAINAPLRLVCDSLMPLPAFPTRHESFLGLVPTRLKFEQKISEASPLLLEEVTNQLQQQYGGQNRPLNGEIHHS